MTNYYMLIDGRVFYDQPIGDQVKKRDEIRKIAKGQEDDYTTGCWIINTLKTTNNWLLSILASKKSWCWSKNYSEVWILWNVKKQVTCMHNFRKGKKNGTGILRRNSKGCVMSKYKYSKVNFKGGLSGRMTHF